VDEVIFRGFCVVVAADDDDDDDDDVPDPW